ncbi:MAG TPA: hypothetical protein VFQ61_26145, partial [Polyangiaceae bacterium]|nr:hypothetical protein [Polyangiaceae bacterium]
QKRALKQAFGEVRVSNAIAVRAGLLKLPMSLYELLPIAAYEFGSSSPVDSLIQDLGVGGRDIGAVVDIAPLHKKRYLHVELGAYNGDANGASNKPGLGLVGGRITSRPISRLRLGFDCLYRPRAASDVNDTGTVYEKYSTGATCSADAEFSYHKFGIRGEFLNGKRTDSPIFTDKSKHTFMAAWGIATYRIKLRGKSALIPAVRVEWLDEDRQSNVGGSLLMSAAMNIDFTRNVRLLFDLSRHNVQVGTRARSAILPIYKPSATSGVIQLQLKL